MSKNGCYHHEREHNGRDSNGTGTVHKRKQTKFERIFEEKKLKNRGPQHWHYNFPGYCIRICYNRVMMSLSRETTNGNF